MNYGFLDVLDDLTEKQVAEVLPAKYMTISINSNVSSIRLKYNATSLLYRTLIDNEQMKNKNASLKSTVPTSNPLKGYLILMEHKTDITEPNYSAVCIHTGLG